MPVFNGLLPHPHGSIVQDLLFQLATWHAYAKLHLHTTDTLNFFDATTKSLSRVVRKFLNATCEAYITLELPREMAVRGRRVAALASKSGAPVPQKSTEHKRKKLNLQTYKYHALGDYADTIRERGTTDNYSTQSVGLSFIQNKVLIFLGRIRAPASQAPLYTNFEDQGDNVGKHEQA